MATRICSLKVLALLFEPRPSYDTGGRSLEQEFAFFMTFKADVLCFQVLNVRILQRFPACLIPLLAEIV